MDFGFIAALVIGDSLRSLTVCLELPLSVGLRFWALLGGFLVLVATTKKMTANERSRITVWQ